MSPHPARIGILSTGAYLPDRIVTNEDVAAGCSVTPDWIVQRTGILHRRRAAPDQAPSDLAARAVGQALDQAGLGPGDLDLLVLATSIPDDFGPPTACRVQALLGAHNAVAFDVTAACSGWLFATRVARDWLSSATGERHAAVVGVEVYSRFLDPTDRATAVLFGDGAAATILGPVSSGGFSTITLGSDGTGADDVVLPAGAGRLPASAQTLVDGSHYIRMNGRAVSDFILTVFPQAAATALKHSGLALDDVDLLISHQPNPALLRHAAAELGIPDDRTVIVGDHAGNLGAACIPYALSHTSDQRRLHPGDRLLIIAFGAGRTWGSTVLTWTKS